MHTLHVMLVKDKLLGGLFNLVILVVSGVEDTVSCSHQAAVTYYTDSIKNICKYTSYPCKSKSEFDRGNCLKCVKGCNQMGYWSSPSKESGSLYLNTRTPLNTDTFCRQNHQVALVSNSKDVNGIQAKGKFTVYFQTSSETSSIEILDATSETFRPDSTEVRLVSLDKAIVNQIENIFVYYKKTTDFFTGWMYENKWSFKYVEVLNGEAQIKTRFCPTTSMINSDQTVKFIKC